MAANKKILKNVKVPKNLSRNLNFFKKNLKNRVITRYLVLGIFLVLLGVLLYFSKSLFIAALVSGKPVTRLELVRELEKRDGKQTLENLISKKLIFSEAQKAGISVSEADVQAEIDKISKSIESQGSTLDAALTMQGQTRADLEENIKIQKMVEKLLKDDIKVSDDDITKYYNDNKSSFPANSKIDDLKDEIRNQLTQEKLSSAFREWMNKLRSESKVIYFVNF